MCAYICTYIYIYVHIYIYAHIYICTYIVVMGHAVTTSRCAYGMNINNAVFQFETCNPGPINIRMKLKRQAPKEVSEN